MKKLIKDLSNNLKFSEYLFMYLVNNIKDNLTEEDNSKVMNDIIERYYNRLVKEEEIRLKEYINDILKITIGVEKLSKEAVVKYILHSIKNLPISNRYKKLIEDCYDEVLKKYE